MVTSTHKTLAAYSQAALLLARTERIDRARLDAGVEATATTSPAGSMSRTITRVCLTPAARTLMSRSGNANHGVSPRSPYQPTMGSRSEIADEKLSGTAEFALLVWPPPARSSQPRCQCCSVPGQANAAACSRFRISEALTAVWLSSRIATTSSGGIDTIPADFVPISILGPTARRYPMASVWVPSAR